MNKELWTIGRMLQWTEQYFRGKGIERARLDGEVLLSHMLGKERIYLYVHYDQPLSKEELNRFRPMVAARAQGRSVAAITGEKEFMGLTFTVNEDVLIPRPDTETIVEAVLALYPKEAKLNLLDVCTGSGAILFSLLHYLPQAMGVGIDISAKALAVAEVNRQRLTLAARSSLWEGNLLAPLRQPSTGQEIVPCEGFDVIVSNPPYIPTAEIDSLAKEVRAEPRVALDGGSDGLDIYRCLLREADPFLKKGGRLLVEIGQGQEEALATIAQEMGCYGSMQTYQDLAGIVRVLAWTKETR